MRYMDINKLFGSKWSRLFEEPETFLAKQLYNAKSLYIAVNTSLRWLINK
jgi:hypothetical protein